MASGDDEKAKDGEQVLEFPFGSGTVVTRPSVLPSLKELFSLHKISATTRKAKEGERILSFTGMVRVFNGQSPGPVTDVLGEIREIPDFNSEQKNRRGRILRAIMRDQLLSGNYRNKISVAEFGEMSMSLNKVGECTGLSLRSVQSHFRELSDELTGEGLRLVSPKDHIFMIEKKA